MKIRDADPCFWSDIPVLRIRPCTQVEAERRAERWTQSRSRKLRRRLELASRAQRRGCRRTVALVPWRELSAGWQQILASFDGLFESDEEEEQAREAYHEGGRRWRAVFSAPERAYATWAKPMLAR